MNRSTALARLTVVLTVLAAVLAANWPEAGAGQPPPKPIFLALGDSYSSGEGLGPFLPGSGGCDRSPEAYPEVVARHFPTLTLKFLACSGATISQINQQVSDLASTTLRRVGVTTITAGGNDLPFSGLIRSCLGATTSMASPTFEYLPDVSGPALCTSAINGAAKLLGASVNPTSGDTSLPGEYSDSPSPDRPRSSRDCSISTCTYSTLRVPWRTGRWSHSSSPLTTHFS